MLEINDTDTDSMIYQIQNQWPYALMRSIIGFFDTSDYPIDDHFDMPLTNKKVVGLIKNKCKGKIFPEFIDLRSKTVQFGSSLKRLHQEGLRCKDVRGFEESLNSMITACTMRWLSR